MSESLAHIERIRKDFQASQRVKDSLNNSIQALAHDLYSKETHFIFELIQNAEDNTYKEAEPSISFRLAKADPTNTQNAVGALIVQNNEIGFSPENVDAICAVGKTTKSKIQGYIGEKGIGFKSVFRITTIPHIFSGGYRFCLPEKDKETGLGYIVPLWQEKYPKGIEPCHTTIILPLDRPDFGYERIEEMLQDIEPETILFLSKLKEIQIRTDTGDRLTILKDNPREPLVQILIEGERQGKTLYSINEFLLYSKTSDKPEDVNHEKRMDIEKRDVSVAFPIDENKESVGKIFAYLPVRSDTGLPFLINADFILASSREEIRGELPWNQWLMNCVANLLADALQRLKEKGQLTVDLLEKFAKRMNELNESNMFYPIVEEVRDALLDQELLPADDGTFVAARNAKLARGADLRKLLDQDQLRALFQSDGEIKWLVGAITQDRTPDLRTYLLNELNVEEVTPDGFGRKITGSFLASQSDEWYTLFYKYLLDHEALWRPPRGHENIRGVLRGKPILRLQDDRNETPFRTDGTLNAFLPPPEDTDLPIVKRQIVGNEQVAEFLKRLGLSQPDVFDDIVGRVLPKYTRQDVSSISKHEHSMDIQKIQRAMASDSEAGKKKVKRAARQTPFLRAVDQNGNTSFKKPSEIYVNDGNLQLYFSGTKGVWFLDEKLDTDHELWKVLGIAHLPRIIKIDDIGCSKVKNELSRRPARYINYELDGTEGCFALMASESSFEEKKKCAYALWTFIDEHLKESSQLFSGKYEWHYYKWKAKRIEASFVVRLREAKWIPTRDQNLERPSDIRIAQLFDEFSNADELINFLEIQDDKDVKLEEHQRSIDQDHANQLGVGLEDIEFLKNHPEEFAQFKATFLAQKQKPAFPERASSNPDRRRERFAEQLGDAPSKEYEQRDRSVRTTRWAVDPVLWLRNQYKNEDGQMICQVCKEEMPFRKRDGEYYFEAVEALSKDYFPKEHEEQFLALCPLCAAMYREFVKKDEGAMVNLKNALMNADDFEVPLRLGELDMSIRFVETHYHDIKTILDEQE